MDGLKSQAKLTRSNSSLVFSSPTIRSSVHSLSSVTEVTIDEEMEEQKPHSEPTASSPPARSVSSRFSPILSVTLISFYALLGLFIWDDISTSESLLFFLSFIAFLLLWISKNKALFTKKFSFCKQLGYEDCTRLGLSCFSSKNHYEPVHWYIGESNQRRSERKSGFGEILREGDIFYTNGDIYEGEFHKGRSNGSGVYNCIVTGRYEGEWVDGKYDGYGVESWAKGSGYRGQYKQGLRHGYGAYKFCTRDAYSGEWCNGQSHGIGTQTCADGSCYIGEFKYGVKHGLGCYHFRNGDRYGGEYFEDKIHGFGVYHFANGHRYEGSWHEGRKQGYGVYTFRNDEIRCGEWDCGSLKMALSPLSDPILRAVQAARKTAENTTLLPNVDNKVDNAVATANRAATAARVAAVKAVQNKIHGKFCNINI